MPLIEAQPDAVAQVYARSLFELAEADGGQDNTEEVLGELEQILDLARADASFGEFISSRVLPAKSRAASLKKMLDGRASDLSIRFLLILNQKGRLGHLSAIVAAYDAIVQDRFGRIEVDVFTPEPASPEMLATIKDRLTNQLSKEIILHPYTDPKMIGGLKLRIGDQLIDASVETHIRRIRERFAAGGADQIRAKLDELLNNTE
ncbi:MAG: ATP synthase F1 subunit delta [Planctomycetota bacterium]